MGISERTHTKKGRGGSERESELNVAREIFLLELKEIFFIFRLN